MSHKLVSMENLLAFCAMYSSPLAGSSIFHCICYQIALSDGGRNDGQFRIFLRAAGMSCLSN